MMFKRLFPSATLPAFLISFLVGSVGAQTSARPAPGKRSVDPTRIQTLVDTTPQRQTVDDPAHPTPVPVATAARLVGAIAMDGRLEETAWELAAPSSSLRQYQPDEGEASTYPMEVRVLYDDEAIYIGARLNQPNGVAAPLARRDQLLDADGNNGSFNSLTTDKLIIRLDPYHNHLDDVWFEVNPQGVKGDQFNRDPSWDPIWEAATQADSEGWSAEMRIPFSQLRFSQDPQQTWGFQIWRYLDQRNEQDMWSFRGRNEP
ncbi:MAG: carbohydrate binding family 9 domain-containing protein, partial [Gemmatimonadetes bacterium]|nr:carbohydrate binding family 9 domain-containing protein [Gemmatimonadota bacterium]